MERTNTKQLKIQALFFFGYGKLFEIYSDTCQTFIYTQVPNIYHSHIPFKTQIYSSLTRGHCQQAQSHVFVKGNQKQKQS